MKVVLASLTWRKKLFALADDSWFPAEATKTGKAIATAELSCLDAASWSLAGRLGMTLSSPCDRCGCEVALPFDDEFVYRLAVEDGGKMGGEVDDESTALWLTTGPVLDLAEVFRERVFLALPEKVLCTEDCRGLCAGCGANLNQEPCRCQ